MRPCWALLPPPGKTRDCTHTLLDNIYPPHPHQHRGERCLHSRFKDNFVNTVGHRAAERALQLGMLFPPAEALKVGVVDEVVPEDQVFSKTRSVMAQWLAIPGEKQAAGSFGASG